MYGSTSAIHAAPAKNALPAAAESATLWVACSIAISLLPLSIQFFKNRFGIVDVHQFNMKEVIEVLVQHVAV